MQNGIPLRLAPRSLRGPSQGSFALSASYSFSEFVVGTLAHAPTHTAFYGSPLVRFTLVAEVQHRLHLRPIKQQAAHWGHAGFAEEREHKSRNDGTSARDARIAGWLTAAGGRPWLPPGSPAWNRAAALSAPAAPQRWRFASHLHRASTPRDSPSRPPPGEAPHLPPGAACEWRRRRHCSPKLRHGGRLRLPGPNGNRPPNRSSRTPGPTR